MTVIVCIDDDFGMTFFGKRQSSDRVLTEKIAQNENLVIAPFSSKLFEGKSVKIDDNLLENAGKNDACFIENKDISPYKEKIGKIIIFKWNRRYPSDKKLEKEILSDYKLLSSEDFVGNSHEKITQEVYVR